jgi:hypothetical protein
MEVQEPTDAHGCANAGRYMDVRKAGETKQKGWNSAMQAFLAKIWLEILSNFQVQNFLLTDLISNQECFYILKRGRRPSE